MNSVGDYGGYVGHVNVGLRCSEARAGDFSTFLSYDSGLQMMMLNNICPPIAEVRDYRL